LEGARYRDLVLKRTAEGLERRILNAADAVVVVSQALKDHAQRLGVPSERISILPTAVEPELFHPGISGEAVRSRYNLDGKLVIGFVGSLKPWHDLDTLLAAAGLLAGSDDRFHLLVVGHGPRMEELRARGENYITCTGAVEHGQVPECLAAMDVIVTPYPRGGEPYFSPLKLFEAMAMGKPAVAAPVGQAADVVVHGENGLLYEPGNPQDLAEKIREVLGRPDRGAGLGAAARRSVVAGHTWERNAGQVVRIAESLLEESRT
jgi:glycosyltransferase involved in cell wall biosynthesis